MGIRAQKILKESSIVRKLFYGDGNTCDSITSCKFNQYISDNKDNEAVLDRAIKDPGIKLVIAPTGAGKSISILNRAKEIVKQDKDCKVVIALPTVALTEQLGKKQKDVYKMVGGDRLDKDAQLIVTTYDKMFEVKEYIRWQKLNKQPGKTHLILDECHLFTTQHLFRKKAIKNVISGIEENLFNSVSLVTATPKPMTLFRYKEIIEFECSHQNSAIEKVEILVVDDVLEYIKALDYSKEFPFVRLNSKEKIKELIKHKQHGLVQITSKDKKIKEYTDIVENSVIDNTGIDGILVTSVLEAGVSITDYPDNIVPIAAFPDNNISADDIEQFLNRIRKNGENQVKCARVVLRKPKQNDVQVSLITSDGTVILEFNDFIMQGEELLIRDANLMDAVLEGPYKIKIQIGEKVQYKDVYVSEGGVTTDNEYSKTDNKPMTVQQIEIKNFREFISILKSNYKRCIGYQETLNRYTGVLEQARIEMESQGMGNKALVDMVVSNKVIISQMAQGGINGAGTLKECLSYQNGQIVVDKRILYMVSYNQFQHQYYYHHDKLKQELEERLNIPVELKYEDTAIGTYFRNINDIWENIEDIRNFISNNCNKNLWDSLMEKGNFYMHFPKWKDTVYRIRGQKHIMEMVKEMDNKIANEIALKIISSSKTKTKVTKYKNCHQVIIWNQMLDKLKGADIKEIPLFNKNKEEKLQVAIFCYLNQKGQTSYKVTDELLEEMISYYAESYSLSVKLPTKKVVKTLMKKMYKSKGTDTIKNELRLDVKDIFVLMKADYK